MLSEPRGGGQEAVKVAMLEYEGCTRPDAHAALDDALADGAAARLLREAQDGRSGAARAEGPAAGGGGELRHARAAAHSA